MGARAKAVVRKLRDAEVLRLAVRFARLARLEKRADQRRKEIQRALLEQLGVRQTVKLQLGDTSITRAQQKPSITYDQAALLKALAPKLRRAITRETVDLNRLPEEHRRRFEATLTRAERKAIASISIDTAALDAELKAGRITEELIAPFRTAKEKAPYIVVTDAAAA